MVNRIKEVIGLKNFSLSHFADHIGVQRATISHILSGRNKPSLEVIQKILNAFPDISADWLVKGNGNMTNSSPTLFTDFENKDQLPQHAEKRSSVEPLDGDIIKNITEKEEKYLEKPAKSYDSTHEKLKPPVDKTKANKPGGAKKSIRIIIMYSDGTYSEHLPMTEN